MILNEEKNLIDIKTNYKTYYEMALSNSPEIAARELYAQLRMAGSGSEDIILFKKMPWHSGELWEALFDRLYKAASEIH